MRLPYISDLTQYNCNLCQPFSNGVSSTLCRTEAAKLLQRSDNIAIKKKMAKDHRSEQRSSSLVVLV